MSLLDKVIDLDLARTRRACRDGLEWAREHPGATIRDLVKHNANWAQWYMIIALRAHRADVALAMLEARQLAELSDAGTVRALSGEWMDTTVVQALAKLWGDAARMVKALADAGWVETYIDFVMMEAGVHLILTPRA
jgi:hypothetical protein